MRAKAAYAFALLVDQSDFINCVAIVFQRRQEAHLLCNVEAKAPEIDNVSALAQRRCAFDQSWFKAVLLEPVRYRWSRNACAAYENSRVFQLPPIASTCAGHMPRIGGG